MPWKKKQYTKKLKNIDPLLEENKVRKRVRVSRNVNRQHNEC